MSRWLSPTILSQEFQGNKRDATERLEVTLDTEVHTVQRDYSQDGLAESNAEKHEGQERFWNFAIRRQRKRIAQ